MVRNGILKFVIVASLTFGGASVTAQDQMKEQKDKDGHHSGMMTQGKHGDMKMEGMSSGMMGGMGSMMGACPMMGGMGHGMGHGMGPMMGMKGADLTDEQQEQLAELHGEQAKRQFTLMQKMQEPRQRLQELMSADEPDIDAIGQAYDEVADLRKEALTTQLENKMKMQEIMKK
ncbi:Spy/CpxP family protein refolding chaperone [Marinobacter salicampi]|uniref:Spy/CpxP family protein refolding chaperone n=1 Tax=Marinobacter salicampi TaxID=435907 RepID=UPI00140A182E|nr:periplasmic heavy metal sensor [Marinobacter salicampi]